MEESFSMSYTLHTVALDGKANQLLGNANIVEMPDMDGRAARGNGCDVAVI